MLLLKHVELRPNLIVLDIGSGAGFPLLELAQRLGTSCKCYGVDPWENANGRAKLKIKNYGVANAEIISGTAGQLPFSTETVDLIVSNLGINNFDDPVAVFAECSRVLKPGGQLALTTNLNGHWREFYRVFEETLNDLGLSNLVADLRNDEEHRGSIASISKLFTDSGLPVSRLYEDQFEMRFLNGTAFLNHYFVKLGWLDSWKKIIPGLDQFNVFGQLENNLNSYAAKRGGLTLTVPMAYIEGSKQ